MHLFGSNIEPQIANMITTDKLTISKQSGRPLRLRNKVSYPLMNLNWNINDQSGQVFGFRHQTLNSPILNDKTLNKQTYND